MKPVLAFFAAAVCSCIGPSICYGVPMAFDLLPESSVAVRVDAGLLGDDSDSSTVSGHAVIDLSPPAAPFQQARITELNLVLDEGFDLAIGFGAIRASAPPANVRAELELAGPVANVIDGKFTQVNNLMLVTGQLSFSLEPEPIDLAEYGQIMSDFPDVRLIERPEGLGAEFDIDLVLEYEVDNVPLLGTVPVMVQISGTARGASAATAFGDFDLNGMLDVGDIDRLSEAARTSVDDLTYDLNGDGVVSGQDRVYWVEVLKRTYFGDSNLDGEFGTSDFVQVFQRGEYEDNRPGNSGWSTGDWNGDSEFDSSDFVWVFQSAGFEKGPRPAAIVVPEPGFSAIALIVLLLCRRARPLERVGAVS
jgi:hypothetical protein